MTKDLTSGASSLSLLPCLLVYISGVNTLIEKKIGIQLKKIWEGFLYKNIQLRTCNFSFFKYKLLELRGCVLSEKLLFSFGFYMVSPLYEYFFEWKMREKKSNRKYWMVTLVGGSLDSAVLLISM